MSKKYIRLVLLYFVLLTIQVKKSKDNKSDIEETTGEPIAGSSDDEQEKFDQIGPDFETEQIRVSIDRNEYSQIYKELINESRHLQLKNILLHRRLAEYYKKRRLEHVFKNFDYARDLEIKYQQKLTAYEEIKEKAAKEIVDIWSTVTAVENQYLENLEYTEKKFAALQNLERGTGTGLIYSRKGKPIAEKTVSRFLTLQMHKSKEAAALSLRYIRARNAVAELEDIVKQLESLGPGLYVYQYEQLHIDHKNYINKIEERDNELIKNRAKCTEHNQILAHIREKMNHIEAAIDFAECDLGEAEIGYAEAREDLGVIKARRDKLRWSLEEQRRKAGLLLKKDLLRDFQEANEEVLVLREQKEKLKTEIANISRQLREARQKTA